MSVGIKSSGVLSVPFFDGKWFTAGLEEIKDEVKTILFRGQPDKETVKVINCLL